MPREPRTAKAPKAIRSIERQMKKINQILDEGERLADELDFELIPHEERALRISEKGQKKPSG